MQSDFENDAVTNRAPQRTRWYTRLWPACLGHGCFGRKRQQCPLYLIEYDPVGQLHQAASVGDVSSMERLINSGKHHVNEYDRKGRASLHYACSQNHPEVVTLLVSNNGTDIKIRDDEGCTPLMKAAQQDNMECLSILLQQGADPHLVDFNGDTALHHAVSRGYIRIASELLDYKANINTKTQHGLTPYQLALNEHQHEMAEFLVRNGANIPLELKPNREEAAAKHPEQTKCTSFIKASRRLKDQVSLREGPAAEQPEQKKKKHVTFNEEVHYNTDMKPFSSAVRPPGKLKSLLRKSVHISGDNGRIKDELSPGLSKNPDIPASLTMDKASTSAIKEDIEQSSSRTTVEDSTSSYAGDRGDNLQEPEKITVHITTLDHTHSLGDASDPPQNINECFSDANSADCTRYTVNTCSEFVPAMSVLLLASVIWFPKCVALAMALLLLKCL